VQRHTMINNGKQELRVVEIRDVALAWLVETHGQSHQEYGRGPGAKQWIETVRRQPE